MKIRIRFAAAALAVCAALGGAAVAPAAHAARAVTASTVQYNDQLCLQGTSYCMGNKDGKYAQGNPTIMWHVVPNGSNLWTLTWAQVNFAQVTSTWPFDDPALDSQYYGRPVSLLEWAPNHGLSGWCTYNNSGSGVVHGNGLWQCNQTAANQMWVNDGHGAFLSVYNTNAAPLRGVQVYLATSCKSCDGTPVNVAEFGQEYIYWQWMNFG